MSNFFRDFSITSLSTLIISIVAFINNIIVTRQIGPEGRGKYAIISNLVIFLSLLLGEGIRRNNLLLVPEYKKQLNLIFTQNILYIFFSSLFLGILYLFRNYWSLIIPNISVSLLILGLLISIMTILWQSLQAIFLGLQTILYYNLIQIMPICITFILNLLGIYLFNFNLQDIIINLLVGAFLTSLIGLYFIRKDLSFQLPHKLLRQKSYAIIFRSTFSAAQLFLIFRGDIFLVNFFLGSIPAGIYSIAALFSELLQKIPNIAGPLLISKSVADKSDSSVLNTSRLSRVIFFINLVAICVLYFVGKDLIIFLFGVKFIKSFSVLLYLIPALFFFGSGSIFYSYFISKSYPAKVLLINGLVSLINISLNIILIPIYGLMGAAVICSFTYFLWTLLFCIYFHQQTKTPYSQIFIIQRQDFKYLMRVINF